MKSRVVIGFLGSTLDQGKTPERWDRWRPTVSLCQHAELKVDRLELLHGRPHSALAQRVIEDIGSVSPETRVKAHVIDFKDPWDFEEVYAGLHDFARAYEFEPDREDYLVNITTGTHVVQICWFLLAEAHVIPAQILQLTPPKRWRERAPGTYGIIDLDLSRYDKIARRFRAEKEEATSFLKSGIETRNPAFNRMIDRIEQVAVRSKSPMLLMGPTGAGKSHLARRIYELKHARHQVKGHFVEVNCATLRGDQTMSALFGHVKGAFTGAVSDRPGLLRAANEGVLFLDEIGELGLDEQAMILRAVEEKRFLPVGSDKEAQSDFQLIAGTNRSLAREVEAGAVPRRSHGAFEPVDFRTAGFEGARGGHRAKPRFRACAPCARHGRERDLQQGGAAALSALCCLGGGQMECKFSRSLGVRNAHGDAGASGPHR